MPLESLATRGLHCISKVVRYDLYVMPNFEGV